LNDPEILDFNENLDARAAQAQEENDPGEAFGLEMFGPTGRGSPAMGRQSPYQMSRNAAASLRSVGLNESHLKDTKTWDTIVKEPQPQPQPKPQPKPLPKVVKAEVRPMSKAKPLQANRNQFYDNDKYDRDAQVAADKLWLRMGHLPLRHRVGEEYEKMMQERFRPQRNKGGTRKRSTKKRSKKSIRINRKSKRSSSKRRSSGSRRRR
jgi:hypothetical protein